MTITRRELLGAAGALMAGGGLAQPARAATRLHLRLLETSDLHMFALDWDYYAARPDPTVGLVKVASLVRMARQEAPNTLLFDNGDIIQGNPLGDFAASAASLASGRPHPMFAAMNQLGYDAATLGNHEFNYGLDVLGRALSDAAFPFVCANLQREGGAAYVPPYRILKRRLRDEDGRDHELTIGVIGFVPPQIMVWDRSHLEGRLSCEDILSAANRFLPELRKTCDLVIALSHSGISTAAFRSGDENVSLHLAALGGFDAVFTGHSHRVFPGPDYAGQPDIDAQRGTLAGVPAVMPGFWGSHLGIIDLALVRDGDKWAVDNFSTEARPISRRDAGKAVSLIDADPAVMAALAPAHAATLARIESPVGTFERPVHSFFVWAGYDPAAAIVNAAQLAYVEPLLAGTPLAALPLLSASAPFKVGYTPDAFIDIAAGPVAIRHIADLYIYPNTVSVVRVTGAVLRDWLEHSARVFARIDPAQKDPQPLLDRRVPTYNFDIIAGVTYGLDLSQPARTDQNGVIVAPQSHRIVDLRHAGQLVTHDQQFLVVTNNYRADGGGKFPGLDGSNVVLRAPDTNRDAVIAYVQAKKSVTPAAGSPWRLKPLGTDISVWFESAQGAAGHLSDAPGLRQINGGAPGYARFAFTPG